MSLFVGQRVHTPGLCLLGTKRKQTKIGRDYLYLPKKEMHILVSKHFPLRALTTRPRCPSSQINPYLCGCFLVARGAVDLTREEEPLRALHLQRRGQLGGAHKVILHPVT